MILVDTGPLVALFDPRDGEHGRCRQILATLAEPLATTWPVLTEAFHILSPGSTGAHRLRDFVLRGGVHLLHPGEGDLTRAFELMDQYADRPMDLADASLVVAAERSTAPRIFTLDRTDFAIYRVRRGHQNLPIEVLGD